MAIYKLKATSTFDSTFDSTFQDQVVRIRGSLGGATFQKIGTSFAIRHRAVPVQKRSPRQSVQKARFQALQSFWRSLDAMQKDTFRDQAINYPRTDSLGNVYTISGINMQQSSNTNLSNAGRVIQSSISAPVSYPDFSVEDNDINVSIEGMAVPITPSVVPSGFDLFVYVTRPLSPGQLSANEIFKLLAVIPEGVDTSALNFWATYLSIWGDPTDQVGNLFFTAHQLMALSNGVHGTTVFASGNITN